MQTRSASEIHLKPAHCAPLDVIVRRRHFELRRPFASHFTRLLPLPFFSFASRRLTTTSAGALVEITIVSAIHLKFAYRAPLHVIVMRGPQHKPRRGFYPPPSSRPFMPADISCGAQLCELGLARRNLSRSLLLAYNASHQRGRVEH
jgi:hypothetical protein